MTQIMGGFSRLKGAARNGNLKVLKDILKIVPYPKMPYSYRMEESPLMLAVKYGHVNVAKFFLDNGVPADDINSVGLTALHYAANAGKFFCVKLLLERGAAVNKVAHGLDGRTPLHSAIWSGNPRIVNLLLEWGAYSHVASGYPARTPQQLSAMLGNLDCFILFEMVQYETVQAILLAAQNGHCRIIQYYLENDGDVNARDKSDTRFLHEAARNGQNSTVNYLLHKGADVLVVDKTGKTPLHYAAQYGHTETFFLLINWEIALGLRVDSGWKLSVNSMICDDIKHYKQIEHWCKALNIPVDDSMGGNSILHMTAKYNCVSIAAFLLSNGEHVNAVNFARQTPLDIAISSGCDQVAKILLENGASLSKIQEERINRLILTSVQNNMPSVIEYLAYIGADINGKVIRGKTLLHIASASGFGYVVSELVKAGADVDAKDWKGRTPLNIAEKHGHTSIVDFLFYKRGRSGPKSFNDMVLENPGAKLVLLEKCDVNAAVEEAKLHQGKTFANIHGMQHVDVHNVQLDSNKATFSAAGFVEDIQLYVNQHNAHSKSNYTILAHRKVEGLELSTNSANVQQESNKITASTPGFGNIHGIQLYVNPHNFQEESKSLISSASGLGNIQRVQLLVNSQNTHLRSKVTKPAPGIEKLEGMQFFVNQQNVHQEFNNVTSSAPGFRSVKGNPQNVPLENSYITYPETGFGNMQAMQSCNPQNTQFESNDFASGFKNVEGMQSFGNSENFRTPTCSSYEIQKQYLQNIGNTLKKE